MSVPTVCTTRYKLSSTVRVKLCKPAPALPRALFSSLFARGHFYRSIVFHALKRTSERLSILRETTRIAPDPTREKNNACSSHT